MRVPITRPETLPLIALLALTAVPAACGGSADQASDPTATQSAGTATAAQATATPAPSPTATPTPVPTPVPLPSAQPTSILWEAHGPVTDKTSTAYVAIDPKDGNVWVGIPFEDRFWIFSPEGAYLESWGGPGTGPGQFDFSDHAQNPSGFTPIAFAPDGSFYVGDTGNHRVQGFDTDRQFVREWGRFGADDGEFVQIDSIATDGTTVYVGDGDHYDIQAFDTQGTYLRTFGGDEGYSVVAVDEEGRVHATNPANPLGAPKAMAIFEPDGSEVSRTVLAQESPEAVQLGVDAAGDSFVPLELDHYPWTEQGVVEIDSAGRVVGMWEGGGDFLAVDPDGRSIYITRGIQLDSTQWTFVRKYALAGS
jgi:hypothetical protein